MRYHDVEKKYGVALLRRRNTIPHCSIELTAWETGGHVVRTLSHWCQSKRDAISQMTCWHIFCWMKIIVFSFEFRLQLFHWHVTIIWINSLWPRQNGRHFADDTFKRIFMNENIRISTNISLKFVPKGLINNTPALVQIMAWRRPGDKPLSESMMVNLLMHICVTRPQWVN